MASASASGSSTVTVSPGCSNRPSPSSAPTGSRKLMQVPAQALVPKVAPRSFIEPRGPIARYQRYPPLTFTSSMLLIGVLSRHGP
jgi:hypothetical protein